MTGLTRREKKIDSGSPLVFSTSGHGRPIPGLVDPGFLGIIGLAVVDGWPGQVQGMIVLDEVIGVYGRLFRTARNRWRRLPRLPYRLRKSPSDTDRRSRMRPGRLEDACGVI